MPWAIPQYDSNGRLIGYNSGLGNTATGVGGDNAPNVGPIVNNRAIAAPSSSSSSSSNSSSSVPPFAQPQNGSSTPASPAYGSQQPSVFGTGTYTAPLYDINDQAITGAPAQSASNNYGLNSVWSNLSNELAKAGNQGAGQVTAAQIGPSSYNAATGQAAQASSAQMQAALGQAAQVGAASMGTPFANAARGGYATSGPIGVSTQGNTLAAQNQLANLLATQAAGGGVSAADLQLQQGAQQNFANQLAALGSQRGSTNAALAQRSAADQAAAVGATLNQQMGIQRAQETLNAQQAEGAVLSAAGSQAAGYNTQAAQLAQQTALANAANAQQSTLANTQNAQQTALANQQAALTAGQQNALLQQQAALANQGATNTMTGANLGALNAAASQNASMQQQTALANQAAANTAVWNNMAAYNAAASQNASQAQAAALANQSARQQAALANQQTQLANTTQYDAEINAILGAQAGISQSNRAASLADQQLQIQQSIAANQVNEQAYQASAQANANLFSAGVSSFSNFLASLPKGGGGSSPSSSSTGGSSGSDFGTGTDPVDGGPDFGFSQSVPYSQYASSDENLKTGIQGGNPMLRSFLDNYRRAMGYPTSDTIDVSEGQHFQNPTYAKIPATAGSTNTTGSTVGGILGGLFGTIAMPGIGTALGSATGALAGSAFNSTSGGSAGGYQQTTPGSGITVDESGWGQNTTPPFAMSDENEKSAITSGNRGMQAFLEQANAQTSAQNGQGTANNAFMASSLPPFAQADTRLPAGYHGNASYGGSVAPFVTQAPSGGSLSGGGYGAAGAYGGGVTSMGGYSPAGAYGGSVAPGGQQTGGLTRIGGVQNGINGADPSVSIPYASPNSPVTLSQPSAGVNWSANPGAVGSGIQIPTANVAANTASGYYTPTFTLSDEREKEIDDGRPKDMPILSTRRVRAPFETDDEDERTPSLSPREMQAMLDELHAYSYRYKNPNAPGAAPGRHVGVMAQDLERSPLGRSFVRDTPNGKMVDYGMMGGTILAGEAMLNDRLNRQEDAIRTIADQAARPTARTRKNSPSGKRMKGSAKSYSTSVH